jgi:hypothetical protein
VLSVFGVQCLVFQGLSAQPRRVTLHPFRWGSTTNKKPDLNGGDAERGLDLRVQGHGLGLRVSGLRSRC